MKRLGVVEFPGSNCQHDVAYILEEVLGHSVEFLWHDDDASCGHLDGLIIPGGFAFGDYLRPGALASKARVMDSVVAYANQGGPVLGICNGFQVLLEVGLLTGALCTNEGGRFINRKQSLKCLKTHSAWMKGYLPGEQIGLDIAHKRGRYVASEEERALLFERGQITLVYGDQENPNGSMDGIAGVCNLSGNVMGLMPHPERASEQVLGGTDGLRLLNAMH